MASVAMSLTRASSMAGRTVRNKYGYFARSLRDGAVAEYDICATLCLPSRRAIAAVESLVVPLMTPVGDTWNYI